MCNLISNKLLWREVVCPISEGKGSPITLTINHLSYLNNQLTLANVGCVGKRNAASVGRLHISLQDSINPEHIQQLINEISEHGSVMVMD